LKFVLQQRWNVVTSLLIAPEGIEIIPAPNAPIEPTLLIAPEGIEINNFILSTAGGLELLIAPEGIEILFFLEICRVLQLSS